MAKVSFVLLVIALIAFQHVSEASRPIKVDKEIKDNELEVQDNQGSQDKEKQVQEKEKEGLQEKKGEVQEKEEPQEKKGQVQEKDGVQEKKGQEQENDQGLQEKKGQVQEKKGQMQEQGGGFEKDLDQAKVLVENDLKEKKSNIKKLEGEVDQLNKSEVMLNQLGDAYKKNQSLVPYGKKLKKFNRTLRRPRQGRYGSVIQNILKDLGLNGGRG